MSHPEPNVDKRYRALKLELEDKRESLALNERKEKSLRQSFLRKSLDTQARRMLVEEWDVTDRTISHLKARIRDVGDELTRIENSAVVGTGSGEDNHPTNP